MKPNKTGVPIYRAASPAKWIGVLAGVVFVGFGLVMAVISGDPGSIGVGVGACIIGAAIFSSSARLRVVLDDTGLTSRFKFACS